MMPNAIPSEEIAELLRGEARIPDDAAHRERVHRVMPWDGHDPSSVRHDDVLTLPGSAEPSFFEGLDSPKVRDSRYFRHPLCGYFYLSQVLLAGKLPSDFEVFPDRVPDVCQCLLFGGPLRPAPREARARNAVSLFGLYQSDWVLHTPLYHPNGGPADGVRQDLGDCRLEDCDAGHT